MIAAYFLLLESAKEQVDEILTIEKHLPNNQPLHLEISKSIRYVFSDIESALDYIAHDLYVS